MTKPASDEPGAYDVRWMSTIPFWGVHVAAVAGVVQLGWSWKGLGLGLALYAVRMFGITGGFHRYFAHRSFKAGRGMQFFLALLGTTAVQKGVLWWSAHHRNHHKYSDQPEDVHSPRLRGFWWSHCQWILVKKHDVVHTDRVKDLMKFPELVFLQKHEQWVVLGYFVVVFLIGGWWATVWGGFVSTVILWHGTFTINSFCHIIGNKRYESGDDSKNSMILALFTLGEGWHNNHHFYQRATNNGFFWWEIDVTYYVLKVLSWVGLVWGLHKPPPNVLNAHLAVPEPAPAPAE